MSYTSNPSGIGNFLQVQQTGLAVNAQNKAFSYQTSVRSTASSSALAYGMGFYFTPKYIGTIRFDSAVSSYASSQSTNCSVSCYYGTGTAPNSLGSLAGGNQIGGNKGVYNATSITYPYHSSWVAEITGLVTGRRYWFDIGLKGGTATCSVSDIQMYIQEKY